MKNAIQNIRSAVLADNMTLDQAEKEIKRFLPDMLRAPGGVLRALNLPAAADRADFVRIIKEQAAPVVKYYTSDIEIDEQIINKSSFCGVYAWAPRECGTQICRIVQPDGLPDEFGVRFFRASCANWPGLRWFILDARGYGYNRMYTAKKQADAAATVEQVIKDAEELAAVRAERDALAV